MASANGEIDQVGIRGSTRLTGFLRESLPAGPRNDSWRASGGYSDESCWRAATTTRYSPSGRNGARPAAGCRSRRAERHRRGRDRCRGFLFEAGRRFREVFGLERYRRKDGDGPRDGCLSNHIEERVFRVRHAALEVQRGEIVVVEEPALDFGRPDDGRDGVGRGKTGEDSRSAPRRNAVERRRQANRRQGRAARQAAQRADRRVESGAVDAGIFSDGGRGCELHLAAL